MQSPTTNYDWTVDKALGSISSYGVFNSFEKSGTVEVLVTDKKFRTNTASKLIKIAEPTQLQLEIADVTDQYRNLGSRFNKRGLGKTSYQAQLDISQWEDQWVLVENHHYLVKAFLLDDDSTPIHLSQNILFDLKLEGLLEIVATNSLGSETIVRASALNDPTGKA